MGSNESSYSGLIQLNNNIHNYSLIPRPIQCTESSLAVSEANYPLLKLSDTYMINNINFVDSPLNPPRHE